MKPRKILKLGTRRSLLAMAQARAIARRVEWLNPGLQVQLVGVETRGDRILDTPLSAVEGKEFFVAELDQALQSQDVDFTVHSMKDLSLERPTEIVLAAVPERENPRDVVVWAPWVKQKLQVGKRLLLGTSSPRRIENVPKFLKQVMPGKANIETVEIRGNVTTRLSRLKEPQGSPRQLDGVVLAFAGLARLWRDAESHEPLKDLLSGMHLMVLPLAECPAAPAQGALAVECRKNDAVVRNMLEKLNDPSVVAEIGWERKLLEDWGGGCHQRFGATCLTHPLIGPLMCVRGKKQDGSYVEEVRWKEPPVPTGEVVSWDGAAITPVAGVTVTALGSDESTAYGGAAVFVAHSKAISEQSVAALTLAKCRVWTSGVASWRRLAKMGIWVEGCAEGLGFLSCVPMLGEPMLSLPPMSEWVVITHGSAVEDWRAEGFSGEIVTTYEAETRYPDEVIRSLSRATHIFWSSGSQYKVLSGYAMPSAVHACGPGRTARLLQENKKNPLVFPSVEEWRRWIRKDAGT